MESKLEANMKECTFINLGASNHGKSKREENDYYATEPIAAKLLLEVEPQLNNIWECACGEGHLAKVFDSFGKLSKATDLIDRGYGSVENFLLNNEPYKNGDIVTNPPFKYAQKFVELALSKVDDGRYVCMFLRLLFLESQSRRKLFEKQPPKTVYVFSKRVNCAKNGDFITYDSSAVAYAWFVWEKGYKGETVVKWIN